jgi:hypothetical protein
MSISETFAIMVCTDCLVWHANGDTTGIDDEEREREVRAQVGIPENYHVAVGHLHTVEDCGQDVVDGVADCPYEEATFSWKPCDACGTRLGGDRFPAMMWEVSV